jgi:nicotinate-nucleotide pyrophosphorylase (carboxylating)
MILSLLNNSTVKRLVIQALEEDIGTGDITTNSIIKDGQKFIAKINTRSDCVVAGLEVARFIFNHLDPELKFEILIREGEFASKGSDIAVLSGSAKAVLTGERVALNFIQRMSAIATMTRKYQDAARPYKAQITDTRKTSPNFRVFEKYSVRVGGGSSHRFGLYDAVLIKDNHIEVAGSITEAIKLVKKNLSHAVKIEVETETLDQVRETLALDVDIIMLDNMTIEMMKQAVEIIGGKVITEASGNVDLNNINQVASTGVDYISTSAITAQAGIVDIGLDIYE